MSVPFHPLLILSRREFDGLVDGVDEEGEGLLDFWCVAGNALVLDDEVPLAAVQATLGLGLVNVRREDPAAELAGGFARLDAHEKGVEARLEVLNVRNAASIRDDPDGRSHAGGGEAAEEAGVGIALLLAPLDHGEPVLLFVGACAEQLFQVEIVVLCGCVLSKWVGVCASGCVCVCVGGCA